VDSESEGQRLRLAPSKYLLLRSREWDAPEPAAVDGGKSFICF
jgi:hypothetical protein